MPRADDSSQRLAGQEAYLKGAVLVKAGYAPFSARWEHDHCEFCWAKFSLRDGDLHEGYCTKDRYRWICQDCYEEFKDRLALQVEAVQC